MFLLYWQGLEEIVHRWSTQDEYSHGFLIPIVSMYIIWEKQLLIKSEISGPVLSGIPIVIVALLVLFVGEISGLYVLIHYSFVFLLLGLSLLYIGKATKYTLVPILLLIFSIPLPYVIEVVLTAKLQLLSSWLGVNFIRLFNIPVFLEGNIIDRGIYQLQVVEACSGLRYLFPLMSLGFIVAYFYQSSWWKRLLIFIATIPITILMNSFRIGMIGILVDKWGISMAEGFLHDFEGWIIFMACAVILIIMIFCLEKITGTKKTLSQLFGLADMTGLEVRKWTKKSSGSVGLMIASIFLFVSFTIIQYLDDREEYYPGRVSFVNFPQALETWKGRHESLDKRVVEKLGMTDYLLMNFENNSRQPVNFYIAYYESQRKGESPHSPKVCVPGGGWEITELKRINANAHPVNRTIIQKGNQKQLVYYWFQGHGRIIANEYINKWYLLVDAILKNRTDGALVRVVTPIFPTEEIVDADKRLLDFLSVAEPELKNYLLD
jgi:exosortase D (VPLPA-CTERM-specific)